jgi:hypothetical protein
MLYQCIYTSRKAIIKEIAPEAAPMYTAASTVALKHPFNR